MLTPTINLGQVLIGLLLLLIAAAAGLWTWRKVSNSAASDVVELLNKRLDVLEKELEYKTRELFDLNIRWKDTERNNERLGRTNLEQQRQINAIRRREGQLVSVMKGSGLAVPEADGEDDDV